MNSAPNVLAQSGCVACLTKGDKSVLLTQAALTWLAFIEAGGVRPVTPWTPQQALDSANGPCAQCLDSWSQNTIITNTSLIWIGLAIAGDTRPIPTVTPQQAFDLDIGPCTKAMVSGDQLTIRAYSALQQINWMMETNLTPAEVLAQSGCISCLSPGDQATIQTIAALELVDYINQGGCPPGTIPPIPTPVPIYWGNYIWDDAPAAPPVFVESDITGVNALFVDRQTASVLSRAGNYEFPARAGVRQLIWLDDDLGAPTFAVAGLFPWELTPAANQPVQSLTIGGKPGKVYFTSEQNTGGNTIAGGNPVVCS